MNPTTSGTGSPAESAGQVSPAIVTIRVDGVELHAELLVLHEAKGLVLSILASGCIREMPRARELASVLASGGIASLTLPLLTRPEAEKDIHSAYWSFDVEQLAHRFVLVTQWALLDPRTRALPIGFLSSGPFASGSLVAAAQLGHVVQAVVCRAGRPDFAAESLRAVVAPTLLIVGAHDELLASLNRRAADRLVCLKELAIVPGAGHLFAEPGAFEQLGTLATAWFRRHF